MFIIITILFIIGNSSLAFLLYCSMQKGQWIDSLLGWQNMLRKFDISGTSNGLILYKILGGCELCFAHLIAFLGFCGLVAFANCELVWWKWLLWYFIYVPTTSHLGLYFIVKLWK